MHTVTLYCEIGKHEWERESQRGRRPRACRDCLEREAAAATPKAPAEGTKWVKLAEETIDRLEVFTGETGRVVTALCERLIADGLSDADQKFYGEALAQRIRKPDPGIVPDWSAAR